MSAIGAAILAFLVAVVLVVFFDLHPAVMGIVILGAAIAFLNARDWEVFGRDPFDLPATAPKINTSETESMDLGDELADLLQSAVYTAGRLVEDKGRLEPFVMYEDAAGNVRSRRVDGTNPDLVQARAREAARAIDSGSPRLVLAVPGVADVDGRVCRVVAGLAIAGLVAVSTGCAVAVFETSRRFVSSPLAILAGVAAGVPVVLLLFRSGGINLGLPETLFLFAVGVAYWLPLRRSAAAVSFLVLTTASSLALLLSLFSTHSTASPTGPPRQT